MFPALFTVWLVGEAILVWATISGLHRLGSLPCGVWLVGGAAALAAIRYRGRRLPILLAALPCALLWLGLVGVTLEQRARVLTHQVRRAALSSFGLAPAAGERTASRPNILVVVSDTLRADHLPIYGYHRDTAPNLSALAESAMVFERAYAQAPSTKPAIASLFTSKYPSQHGAIDNEHALDDSLTTLAETLAAAGYRTGAFVENRTIGREFRYDRGFEHWVMDPRRHAKRYKYLIRDMSLRDLDIQIDYWAEDNCKAECFLYVHYIDPHSPYEAPQGYLGYYGDADERVEARLAVGDVADEDIATLIDRYDEEIRYVDQRFANLVDTFEKLGLLDDTVVIFLSDHGEGFGEHGYTHHSTSVYSDLIHIPLIIRYPKRFPAGRSQLPVQHIDLFPTIAELVGADMAQAAVEGRSLLGALAPARRDADETTIIAEHLRKGWGTPGRAIIRDGYKLVHHLDTDRYELFDVARDAGDANDLLATESTDAVASLKAELERHVKRTRASEEAVTVEISDHTMNALRELGYVD